MKPVDPETTLHIYTRVSTSAQQDKGTSLASQEAAGRQKAAQLGFGVRLWNEGGRSSNHSDIEQRPELDKLLKELSNCLVIWASGSDQSLIA